MQCCHLMSNGQVLYHSLTYIPTHTNSHTFMPTCFRTMCLHYWSITPDELQPQSRGMRLALGSRRKVGGVSVLINYRTCPFWPSVWHIIYLSDSLATGQLTWFVAANGGVTMTCNVVRRIASLYWDNQRQCTIRWATKHLCIGIS